ncbi:M14 family metallopeptidase [Winogradskyella maritima]|uniref:M14 family metallopeptidase n=1 Tax=Winogradskyella maritima TaxID=1517766 RepID=A0ABV8AK61_9FLAO|nr:M14 family metallopeptidase [Winogradskyella maritima]
MKKLVVLFLLIISCADKNPETVERDFTTVFEKSEGTETATYEETIAYYEALADAYSEISIKEMGMTDSGKPLHIVTLNMDGNFDLQSVKNTGNIILINNGIHPGESDGIDATMMLFRDIAGGKIPAPDHTTLVTIPIYNIGGSLNRNSTTRTNQNGPTSYGFRGNARNYDLNRDFIKSDTKNARAFAEIFHIVKPDVFIDNHVSNGADYQYTLTHLFTQHNKLGGVVGEFLHTKMMPQLEQKLTEKSWDITPYVNVFNSTPESGFSQFMDSPRYSTGYTTLWNTLGMMVETHMLKPYKQRVEGTYELMVSMLELTEEHGEAIKSLRVAQNDAMMASTTYPIQWQIDTTQTSTLNFKGYEGTRLPSEVTNGDRLYFDKGKPFTKETEYRNYFKSKKDIVVPKGYIIPQGWHNVIDLLKLNDVSMTEFEKDSTILVESYKIDTYESRRAPYEGHYLHYNTTVKASEQNITVNAGDYYVETRQESMRYIIETLEPEAVDSFFNWNFFDTILQQKEGFSPYVWEDKAKLLLAQNPQLQIDFNLRKSFDEDFAKNWYAQLDWLHKQSDNYEKAHMQYPIYRVLAE